MRKTREKKKLSLNIQASGVNWENNYRGTNEKRARVKAKKKFTKTSCRQVELNEWINIVNDKSGGQLVDVPANFRWWAWLVNWNMVNNFLSSFFFFFFFVACVLNCILVQICDKPKKNTWKNTKKRNKQNKTTTKNNWYSQMVYFWKLKFIKKKEEQRQTAIKTENPQITSNVVVS